MCMQSVLYIWRWCTVEQKKPWIVTDMLVDPLFVEGLAGAKATFIRAAFSVPVLDGDKAIASLACHYPAPHTPSALDIERNEVFAKLIAISLKGRTPLSVAEPIFASPIAEPSVEIAGATVS